MATRGLYPISQQLSATQQRWPTIEKEAFAIVMALKKFRQYLLGAKVTVFCDHQPLKSLFTAEMKNAKVQRWAIMIDEYQCEIQYRPGKSMKADFVSRITNAPLAPSGDAEVAVLDSSQEAHLGREEQVNEQLLQGDSDQLIEEDHEYPAGHDLLCKLQREDMVVGSIIESLNGETSSPYSNEFFMEDELLWRIAHPVRFDSNPRQQLVLTTCLAKATLVMCHDKQGHMGKIRRRFFWMNAYKDVVLHIWACIPCNQRSLRQRRAALKSLPHPNYPFQIIATDIIGPYPESESGNKYVLSIVCLHSGWPEAFAIPSKEAEIIAEILLDEIIPRHFCPNMILTDQGREFCNQIMKYVTSKLCIHKIRTTPYHPEGKGRVEGLNHVLNDVIAKVVNSNQGDWDEHLSAALSAIRTSVNDSSRHSPFFLLYGRDPVLPMDTLLKPKIKYLGEDHLAIKLERMHRAYVDVKENMAATRARNQAARWGDPHLEDFQVGDAVYYHLPHLLPGQCKKLARLWKPFYRIIKKVSDVTFVIKHQPTGITKTIHVNHLRKAFPEGVWDKRFSQCEDLAPPVFRHGPVASRYATKYGRRHRLAVSAPARRQPVQSCRLSAPLTVPVASDPESWKRRHPSGQGDGRMCAANLGGHGLKRPCTDRLVRQGIKRRREDGEDAPANAGAESSSTKKLLPRQPKRGPIGPSDSCPSKIARLAEIRTIRTLIPEFREWTGLDSIWTALVITM